MTTKTSVLVLILFSLAVRLGMVFVAMQDPQFPRSNDDYLQIGADWLSTGTYQEVLFPPVYPAVNALALTLSRGNDSTAILLILLTQATLGVLTVLMVFDLGTVLIGNSRAGLLGALLFAFDPAVLIHGVLILSENLYVFLIVAASWVAVRFSRQFPARAGALIGAILGIATLTRSVGVLAFLVLVLLEIVTLRSWINLRLALAITVLIFVSVNGLWSYQNYLRYGHFFSTVSGPYNFAVLIVGPAKAKAERMAPKATTEMWQQELGSRPLASGGPVAASRELASVALDWGKEHPVATMKSIAEGQLRVWIGPGLSSWKKLFPSTGAWIAAALLVFRLGTLFGVLIYWLKRRPLSPLIAAVFTLMAVVHVMSAGAAAYSRFLVPAVPFIAIVAACGISGLIAVSEPDSVADGPAA